MEGKSHSTDEKIRLFRVAADKHQQLYRDSMNGKGIDRHLFALFITCKGLGYVRIQMRIGILRIYDFNNN